MEELHIFDNQSKRKDLSTKSLLKLERDDLFAFSRKYLNKSDPLYKLVENVKPEDGYEDFVIHGQPDFVEYETTNGQWIQLTASEYAEALQNDIEYHGGNIRLLAYKSGMLNDGFAQQLANILHVKVKAPTQTLWINENGDTFITDSQILADMWDSGETVKATGIWKVFLPRE